MAAYIADQSWSREPARLQALEHGLDRNTARYLTELGVGEGARCLEIGAGSGSIARWLAERVGAEGHVVATDLDTTLLLPLATQHANLELRREDIAERIPEGSDGRPFDIAHARLVLGHVARPTQALQNSVRAVRPGGFVLIEEVDFFWTELGAQPLYPSEHIEPYFKVWSVIVATMRERGYAVHWGRHLAGALREAGLEHVAGEAALSIGDQALQRAMRLTIERFALPLTDSGRLSADEVAACLRTMDEPSLLFTGSPIFSIWGRVPPASTAPPSL